ncbi:hypothetical protein DVA76_19170, partial [Acinetobacter baumannii]
VHLNCLFSDTLVLSSSLRLSLKSRGEPAADEPRTPKERERATEAAVGKGQEKGHWMAQSQRKHVLSATAPPLTYLSRPIQR